jgi:hypothetical protein
MVAKNIVTEAVSSRDADHVAKLRSPPAPVVQR